MPKKNQKNQKKPKKTKKAQKPVSNFECQPKPKAKKTKKTKKTQKKPKKTSFQFRILAKTNAKKTQKKPKKTKKKPMPIWKFQKTKKPKKNQKKPMPIYRFWCSDWFFWGEHPPFSALTFNLKLSEAMEWDNNFDLVLNSFISLLFWGQSFYILIYYAGFGMKSRCTFLSVELTPYSMP